MGFKLKNKNVPTNFLANYVRPTNLSIQKSPLKQSMGKAGSDLRRQQYDAKGWAYDDTIAGDHEGAWQPKNKKKEPAVAPVDEITPQGAATGLGDKITGAVTSAVDSVKKMDPEDFIIPQSVQNLVPINVRAFASDLLGLDRDITERHLSKQELAAITAAREKAEAAGRSYIKYDDWDEIELPNAQDEESSESNLDFLRNLTRPSYNTKTTFGRMGFEKNDDGTYTYTDRFNFNDAKGGGFSAWRQALKDQPNLSMYQKLRKLGTYLGSGEGEGANIKIVA